ncbi:MAG: hypothetical protein A2V65_04175 [Deltaproteobacteria bacterium RBG_13_49_15]|nr:MAG: hypothetical protein A2V65_04175 [Deltaproteobacteria bacterium RBG_13_49_15]
MLLIKEEKLLKDNICVYYIRKIMETKKHKPRADGIQAHVVKGTEKMGYWKFKKEFCSIEGWQMRRLSPQTYEVLNNKRKKIGIFKSGKGYFPN